MRCHRIIPVALAAVLIAGTLHCATQLYQTGSTVDTQYDFSKVKTFAFAQVPEKPLNSANGKLLRQAIENAMKARGFDETTPGNADLWISYDIGVLSATSVSWGNQSTLGEGRIIVRAIDPASRHEVWYGWAEANLQRVPDPEARIPAAVDTLFQTRVKKLESPSE